MEEGSVLAYMQNSLKLPKNTFLWNTNLAQHVQSSSRSQARVKTLLAHMHGPTLSAPAGGGPNSGLDGGNDGGKGITDTPGGLKFQCEGHDVRYRNAWIKELDLKEANTDFKE